MQSSPKGEKQTENDTTDQLEGEREDEHDAHDGAQSANMEVTNHGENMIYQAMSSYLSIYKKGITMV